MYCVVRFFVRLYNEELLTEAIAFSSQQLATQGWSVGQPLCQLALTPPPRGRPRLARTNCARCKFGATRNKFVEQSCDFLHQTRKMQARHVQTPINGLCAVLPYINYTCTLQHCQGIFSNNSAGKVLKKSDEALDKSP